MAISSSHSVHSSASRSPHSFIEISPPRPWMAGDELPAIVDMPSFRRVHRQLDDKLKAYLGWPHSNYQTMARDSWNELRRSDADMLFSCNAEARIRFAEILCAQLESFGIAKRGPHNWITVTPAEFVLPLDRAHDFKPQQLVALIREALGDVPAVGIIEAAHYHRWGPDGPSLQDHVSWHAHLATWERSRAQLQDFVGKMSKRKSMRGRSAVWVEPISAELVTSKIIYACKGQTKTYRLTRQPDRVDLETGEITERYRQQKDWIRTGNHVRMIKALRGRYLPDLIFGNAAGTQVARAVRYTAMRPFCRWAERQNVSAEYAGRSIPYPIARTYQAIGKRLAREIGFVSNGEGIPR